MIIKAIIITTNNDILPKNAQNIIPKQAVVILGSADNCFAGIKKFICSFYKSDEWAEKEAANNTIFFMEPLSGSGEWHAILTINKEAIKITGIFKLVNYVAF